MSGFFDINIKILKISGLWVSNGADRTPRLVYNALAVFYSMVFFTVAELLALQESSKNISDLVKNLNMSMSFLLTFFKVCVWFYNRKTIVRIMRRLEETAANFSQVDGIIKGEKRVKDGLTYTFFVIAFMVPTSACLLTFFNVFFGGADKAGGGNATEQVGYHQKLPYHSFVPFDYNASKLSYCVAVVYQCLALLICGTITVGFDMLYTSLVSFTSTHLKILQEAFKSIRARCAEKLDFLADCTKTTQQLSEAMDEEMTRCIKHLQLVLRICEQLEDIFTYLILLQILISLVVFCTCLYLVSTIPIGTQLLGNELVYLLAIENQLALYCYAGNKLTLRGEGIPFAVYSGDWYAASKKFKSNMIITMMRMNKPIHLTAGKFTNLTLPTFVTIGRGSYSLLAVLKR